jgi:hypothetical protein
MTRRIEKQSLMDNDDNDAINGIKLNWGANAVVFSLVFNYTVYRYTRNTLNENV